jgi:hypothetical protein
MKHMDFTYEVISDQNANTSTHDWARDSNFKFNFALIFVLNPSFMMTPSSLHVFNLLIFTLFNLSLFVDFNLAT